VLQRGTGPAGICPDCRGRQYFSPAHFGRLHRFLSYYPQLEQWARELLGDAMELAKAS